MHVLSKFIFCIIYFWIEVFGLMSWAIEICIVDVDVNKKHIYNLSNKVTKKNIRLFTKWWLDSASVELWNYNGKYLMAIIFYKAVSNSNKHKLNGENIQKTIKEQYNINTLKKITISLDLVKRTNFESTKANLLGSMRKTKNDMNNSVYNSKCMVLIYNLRNNDDAEMLSKLYKRVRKTIQSLFSNNLEGNDKVYLLKSEFAILANINEKLESERTYKQYNLTKADNFKFGSSFSSYMTHAKLFNQYFVIFHFMECLLKEQKHVIRHLSSTINCCINNFMIRNYYYQKVHMIKGVFKSKKQNNRNNTLVLSHKIHKYELNFQEHIAQLRNRNLLLIFSEFLIVYLIVLLRRKSKYYRGMQNENIQMVFTIKQLTQQNNELKALKPKTIVEVLAPRNEVNIYKDIMEVNTAEEIKIKENTMLFNVLDQKVDKHKLYLNPDLSREILMKLINVNKNRFAQIIQQSTGNNSSIYINTKRLEYAVHLLEKKENYTILFIADSCGLPNIPTFNRQFKAKYGMTPIEFKNRKK